MYSASFIYRLYKEKQMYEKETKQQEEKIERMKTEGADEYVLKKQASTPSWNLLMCFVVKQLHFVLLMGQHHTSTL